MYAIEETRRAPREEYARVALSAAKIFNAEESETDGESRWGCAIDRRRVPFRGACYDLSGYAPRPLKTMMEIQRFLPGRMIPASPPLAMHAPGNPMDNKPPVGGHCRHRTSSMQREGIRTKIITIPVTSDADRETQPASYYSKMHVASEEPLRVLFINPVPASG